MIVIYILLAVAAALGIVAAVKKPESVYRLASQEQNPMEGKRVKFVEDPDEPANADGKHGQLHSQHVC